MPGASLLTLLDDITSVLDDVAVLTKLATKKTAGVLGDDLALNAQQVAGVAAKRELPVVWAVARGSLVNKAILVPAALLISQFIPWAIAPLLMVGGAYLCFEGFEKVLHALLHARQRERKPGERVVAEALHGGALQNTAALGAGRARPEVLAATTEGHALVDATESHMPVAATEEHALAERAKIKGAVRTDFVLSAEIVTIALGSIETAPFVTRLLVLTSISLVMTVGVYGLVGIIVKLDDFGAYLCTVGAKGHLRMTAGKAILATAPWLLKILSFVGTIAMFLVGGGIIAHGAPLVARAEHWVLGGLHGLGSLVQSVGEALFFAAVGLFVGATVWAAVQGGKAAWRRVR